MTEYYPHKKRLTSLEKNILKYRALEMILILFYIEDLKLFVVNSMRATDAWLPTVERAATCEETKNSYKTIWKLLVSDGILTSNESADIQRLIDYRNTIAHRTQHLTSDIGATHLGHLNEISYDYEALEKILAYREKTERGMSSKYVISISFRSVIFDSAERAYSQELRRLKAKIQRQVAARQREIDEVKANI